MLAESDPEMPDMATRLSYTGHISLYYDIGLLRETHCLPSCGPGATKSQRDPETPPQPSTPLPPCLPPRVSQAMTQHVFPLPMPTITQDRCGSSNRPSQLPFVWLPTVPGQPVHIRLWSLAAAAPASGTLSLTPEGARAAHHPSCLLSR